MRHPSRWPVAISAKSFKHSATVRLNPDQVRQIRDCIRDSFGAGSRTWLFGSRTDDLRRGGDVDLYVEPEHSSLRAELKCKSRLKDLLDLDVDLIVRRSGHPQPIHQLAREKGVPL